MDKDWDREREKRKKDKAPVGVSNSAAPSNPGLADMGLQGKSDEEIEMMKLMGFATFDTTKGKKVSSFLKCD
jgi:U4/U6.U5 tri-snRNP-associated protein 3